MPALIYPDYAYVPGRTPRHPESLFEALRKSVGADGIPERLMETPAWIAGLSYLEEGFFWEAHEVLEPVWVALAPGSDERELVQALIQLANACLKREMGRPQAVLRICEKTRAHLNSIRVARVMGQSLSDLQETVQALENQAHRDMPNWQENAK
ncbi:DUF309 domain-containing protein [Thalassobius sp. S69A]|uniref:DUF309 domain-containing protein n=1 Tax=unclassified Thalassovita TaxID=2619711 RepID=UPI000C0D891C|nr:hypothetical protein [Paracoccaceae bacterium]MBT26660.1 hypothetical protein [Paracoccaceae bacterium]|tara:strand:- start:122 stop:583 length:462 start_codon:yes stop_codon:yes gene_type:complete